MTSYTTSTKDSVGWNNNLQTFAANLPEGNYLISFLFLNGKSDIKEYRRCYFAKLDALCQEVGETRYDMHEIVKENVLATLIGNSSLFIDQSGIITTSLLTQNGWIAFINAFEIWAFTNYNTILR